jgi:hypothetical protein
MGDRRGGPSARHCTPGRCICRACGSRGQGDYVAYLARQAQRMREGAARAVDRHHLEPGDDARPGVTVASKAAG